MEAVLEGLLYLQGDEGLSLEQIRDILEITEEEATNLINRLQENYQNSNRGLTIKYLGNAYKLTTKEEHKKYYEKLVSTPKYYRLSNSALETLAIIAYNEPITRIEIDKLRGVDSSYVIRKLVAKGLIKESGRSDLPGHPLLYKTTDDFLDCFNLSSLKDLPDISKYIQEETEIDEDSDLFTSIYKEEN